MSPLPITFVLKGERPSHFTTHDYPAQGMQPAYLTPGRSVRQLRSVVASSMA
jgi:hypothetical protein